MNQWIYCHTSEPFECIYTQSRMGTIENIGLASFGFSIQTNASVILYNGWLRPVYQNILANQRDNTCTLWCEGYRFILRELRDNPNAITKKRGQKRSGGNSFHLRFFVKHYLYTILCRDGQIDFFSLVRILIFFRCFSSFSIPFDPIFNKQLFHV